MKDEVFWIKALTACFILLTVVLSLVACSSDDDDDNDSGDDDDTGDDDTGDDDSGDDDSGDDDDTAGDDDDDVFPPEEQTPFMEKGFILPPKSLECYPVGEEPTMDCNHHGSSIAELPGGDIAVVWYHGKAEKSLDSRLVWSKLTYGETEWSFPEVLFDDPDRSDGNPTIWVHEDESLYVFVSTIYGDGWDQAWPLMLKSNDGGVNWSEPVNLREGPCWMIRHRPVRLTNGDLLLPLYNECLAYPVYMRSTDDFATWTEEPHLNLDYYLGHVGQIQPSAIVLPSGSIAVITRDGFPTNKIGRTLSHDQGVTWTSTQKLSLPNSGTGVDHTLLLDGHVVVVYNNSPERRFPLTVALSRDEGETYIVTKDLNNECEGEGCSYPYPSIMQSKKDGTLWVTYTHERETIGWVHFNEAWMLEE